MIKLLKDEKEDLQNERSYEDIYCWKQPEYTPGEMKIKCAIFIKRNIAENLK